MKLIEAGGNKVFIECSCGTEGVLITSEYDVHQQDSEFFVKQEYFMSFFGFGQIRSNSWKWRIRQAWRILRKGTPYTDMIVLTRDEAMKVASFIANNLVTTKPTTNELPADCKER